MKARMPRMPRSPKATADDFHVYSGERELRSIRELGTWPDGAPVGRGFPQPCLQDRYAAAIIEGRKTFEGRPGGGWLTSRGDMIRPGDYVNFQLSQRRRLIVRVLSVHFFRTFEEMLKDIGVQNLLPDAELSIANAAEFYRTFGIKASSPDGCVRRVAMRRTTVVFGSQTGTGRAERDWDRLWLRRSPNEK